jgi:23S rRNA (guanosine2251-2'-O)-methyltransferase
VLAALQRSGRVREIWLDAGARPDPKLDRLLGLARERHVPVVRVPREDLDRHSQAAVHNGVVAFADGLAQPSLKEVLDEVIVRPGRAPLILLLDEVQYEQNLGAILRTAACTGVDAVVVPTRRGAPLSAVVQRIAMGGAEEVPVIREGLLSALATLRREGFRVLGAERDGSMPCWEADWTGPLALVMGGEDHGIGPALRSRCDDVVSLPIRPGSVVDSLNVSVTAGVLLYLALHQRSP